MSDLRGSVTGILSIALGLGLLGRMLGLLSGWELDMIGVVSVSWILFRMSEHLGAFMLLAAMLGILAAGALLSLRTSVPGITLMPYLLIIPANFYVAWMFVRGLWPGREPVLLRLIKLMDVGPVDDPGFCAFVRGQCWLWAGLALSNAVLGLFAIHMTTSQPWIADTLMVLVIGQLLWFAVSHHYASTRYGRRETWWATARAMTRPDIWTRLTAP
ncbi:MAG: hypothetical protein AB8B85_17510 [Paracoccaceae bacterium]